MNEFECSNSGRVPVCFKCYVTYVCLSFFFTYNQCNYHCIAQEKKMNIDAELTPNMSCIPRRSSEVHRDHPLSRLQRSGTFKTQKQERFLIEYLDAERRDRGTWRHIRCPKEGGRSDKRTWFYWHAATYNLHKSASARVDKTFPVKLAR